MGPGKFIGVVMQMLTAPLCFILSNPVFFLGVGLCSRGVLPCAGHMAAPWTSNTRASIEMRQYDGLGVHAIVNHNTCVENAFK